MAREYDRTDEAVWRRSKVDLPVCDGKTSDAYDVDVLSIAGYYRYPIRILITVE